ncbi:MAG: tetratricopeptide repeat protein [Bacteroidetes bacterium]|nr:tetratricopeptide repeat protein [Bacteroidota bacterium]
MKLNRNYIRIPAILFLFLGIAFGVSFCGSEKTGNAEGIPSGQTTNEQQDPFLNHNDSVHYVGMQTCRKCHENIYATFIHTGMGKSFDLASPNKSVGKFGKESVIHDATNNMSYHSYFRDSAMFMTEFRLEGKDTVYSRTEKVNYIIGSGQHTNSHMRNVNGYVFQMPMTYYAQKGEWDLPPGFEKGFNSRFERKIGLECMTCHNSFPGFVEGSENKFSEIPNGINCERCHGPGSFHVAQKMAGNIVDTSKYIDYTIVNPAKLSPDLQFDVCQRCHLQGNAVLMPGKSFFDFRPGMKLSDYETVFMPKYEGAEDQFIMASHAERLKMSQCFLVTEEKITKNPSDNLRPYKDAFTCVTCHNPHVTVQGTPDEHFNSVCSSCHGTGKSKLNNCSDTTQHLSVAKNNCVSCHLPRSGAIDIPHVTVHDHFIRKPSKDAQADIAGVKKFLGLYAVNDKNPSSQIKARAYLQQFEKVEHDPQFLDSAKKYLPETSTQLVRKNFEDLVHYYFLKNNFAGIKSVVERCDGKFALDSLLTRTSFDNADAWTAYRIGEGYFSLGDPAIAEIFYKKAVALAPYYPDFRSKYALSLATQQKKSDARAEFQHVLDDYPQFVPALTNLGYLWLEEGDDKRAESYYDKALALSPDDEQALMNKAGLNVYRKNYTEALKYVNRTLKVNPENKQAIQLKTQLSLLK